MALASQRQGIPWKQGEKVSGAGNGRYLSGKYVNKNGYIMVLQPGHPHGHKGYVLEHRLIMERYLGRYLKEFECVHHINEIKTDNRMENFFLTSIKEHTILHKSGQKISMESRRKGRTTYRNTRKAGKGRKRQNNGRFV